MIAGLKPYPEYKVTGLPWLGQVPGHWDIRRLKFLLREVDSRSTTGKEQLLRVSQYTGVTQRKSADGSDEPDTRASSLVGYKKVSPDDLVINIMLAWNGSLGISRYDGIASPAYCVYRFNNSVLPWYCHEMLRLPAYKGRIKIASTGVVESRLRLYSDNLGNIEAILPPPDEQAAIVRFLDHATRRLDKAIRDKRKIIALLNEQKQAIIHRAVTRGLDPDVTLKDSGIPWLGQIPAHWEVLRARFLFRVVTRRDIQANDPKLSVTQRRGIVPTDQMEENSTQARNFDRFQVCHPQDLVLNKYKAHLGIFCCAFQRGLITPNYTVFRPARELCTEYFDMLFHTHIYRDAFSMIVNGVTEGMSPLYTQEFYRVPVIFPNASEQRAILEEVKKLTQNEDAAIDRAEREIELLHEYRTRLIADVVTGKLDVREAAAHLPEVEEAAAEPDAMEPAESAEELMEEDA